ncbi:MAG: ATP-binding protein [bacterium]|nr:ATP-binding protein [bacterium]
MLFSSGCQDSNNNSFVKKIPLNTDSQSLPYSTELLYGGESLPADLPNNVTTVMCDIDGDGVKEFVEGTYQKFIGKDSEDHSVKPRWEIHLPDQYVLHDKENRLGVCADFNGDGIEEIYFTARTKDHLGWRFCVLDPAETSITINSPLPVGEDRRRPAYWDGFYQAEGVLLDADGHGNPGIVLARRVGYDASNRGVCVVSPQTGEIIWEYVCGAQPQSSPMNIVDMDGDGTREILFSTSGPGNLGDRQINGTGDSEIYLIALSHTGEEIMKPVIGGVRFQGMVTTFDFDGNGIREIVTATSNGNNGRTNELSIWDWESRQIIKCARASASFVGISIMPGAQKGHAYIFTGSDNGTIDRYHYDGSILRRDIQVLSEGRLCTLLGQFDILPPLGQELIVELDKRENVVVLNKDLQTLAIFSDDKKRPKKVPLIWPQANRTDALILSNNRCLWILGFEETPVDWAGLTLRWGLPLLVLLLIVTAFYFGKAAGRRNQTPIRANLPDGALAADQEALFRLFQELEDVHHSVVGQTKGLERLVWLLDAFITDLGVSEELELRIRQVMDDFQSEEGPRLLRLLHLADQTSFDPVTVLQTRKALNSLTHRFGKMSQQDLTHDLVIKERENLRTDWNNVRDGFLVLRSAINKYFTTDAVRLIQGMLLVRDGDFQRAGIEAKLLGGDSTTGIMNCRIDNGDLRFVLDNLLDNAVRAMKESSHKYLTVQLVRAGTEVSLRVTDSGQGMESDQFEAIFSNRVTSRAGGGRGLYRSREILGRWGSEIQLLESAPGKGCTFIVKLLAADDDQEMKTLKAQA